MHLLVCFLGEVANIVIQEWMNVKVYIATEWISIHVELIMLLFTMGMFNYGLGYKQAFAYKAWNVMWSVLGNGGA